MTDIVERLRNGMTDGTSLRWNVTAIHREAADEIERLRDAMRADDLRLRIAGERVGIIQGCDLPDWMVDEIERLRAGGCARDQHTTQYCAELRAAVKAENEACARVVEAAASVTFDAGPPAPGKVISGITTITNDLTASQAAAAIRARMEAKP